MSNDDEKSVLLTVLAGIGLGAIIGAAAGLLFAPKAGMETREDLKKAADDLKSKAEGIVGELSTSVEQLVQKGKEVAETAKTKIGHAVDAGKQAMAETKESLRNKAEESSDS